MNDPQDDLIKRAARDLVNCRYAVALTGAGISTESGVPDFRGPSGIWTKDPQAERRAYRSYESFLEDPKTWWEERLGVPNILGNLDEAMPNAGHRALAELEKMGLLKCVITQNVDGLHEKAGSRNVLEYHGSLLKLRCMSCMARYRRNEFDLVAYQEANILPPLCSCGGVIKSDGVAFGEPIPADVASQSVEEARRCDLMLICGTSAVVYPFANLPRIARQRRAERPRKTQDGLTATEKIPAVMIIEINAEPTPLTYERISDYLIRGKTGEILPRIVREVKELHGT
jgi:NAD-dependent deacetylase